MADQNELIQQDEIEQLLRASMGEGKGNQGSQVSYPAKSSSHSPSHPPGESVGRSLDRGGLGAQAASAEPGHSMASGTDVAGSPIGQDEVERLLGRPGVRAPAAPSATATLEEPRSAVRSDPQEISQSDIESLLHQAEKALASIEEGPSEPVPPGVASFRWEELSAAPASAESANLDLIRDVELDLCIELGRTQMYLEDVLRLRRGSVVTLDKLAGDPVDIFVNGRLVARGEVLVLNDNFCVRVAELVAGVSSA